MTLWLAIVIVFGPGQPGPCQVEGGMGGAGQSDPDVPGLIDVTDLPVDRLIADGDSVLANAIRRLLIEFDGAREVLSAFDNFAGDPPGAASAESER
ncbi:hypothetical protein FHR83_008624 [Actinoplanes campanulatus]|uniref:FXSXX-COOH protein n=2 Tax=Actinoplanes campanulatus TaxID=113559 RepID=A0A7W5FJK4_9ACTN|nr:hypothetical protein [Actinoplanes campanulatus]MBB3100898.1 hypothetical protein [Actinoplanes campanulatus]